MALLFLRLLLRFVLLRMNDVHVCAVCMVPFTVFYAHSTQTDYECERVRSVNEPKLLNKSAGHYFVCCALTVQAFQIIQKFKPHFFFLHSDTICNHSTKFHLFASQAIAIIL